MKNYISIVIFACLAIISCSEFIERSVENRKVILLAPADKQESSKYNQNFWWEPVEDALFYRLQVVSPDFNSPAELIVDTLIGRDKFEFSLSPGKYEWRVRAENGSSKSLYSSNSLTIHLSSLKEQEVKLSSPANNSLTNQKNALYKWNELFGALQYRLQVDTSNFADTSKLLFDHATPNNEFSSAFPKDGAYQWRVRAEADTIRSRWSAIYNIRFDGTAPAKVTLNAPANNQQVTKPVSLQWGSDKDAAKYQILVLKSDSVTVYNNTYPLIITGNTHDFNEGISNERIYWKVRAIDQAGNTGIYSDLRSFLIQ